MSMYPIDPQDVVKNVLKTHPKVVFKFYKGYIVSNIEDVGMFKLKEQINDALTNIEADKNNQTSSFSEQEEFSLDFS